MGRRRASHLNPGHVVVDSGSGYERVCKLTLDSRFGITAALTDPISTWGDRSDLGNDATGSGTARPTSQLDASGRRVVRFDGDNDFLPLATLGITSATVFLLAKSATGTGDKPVLAKQFEGGFMFTLPWSESGDKAGFWWGSGTRTYSGTATSWSLFAATLSAGGTKFSLNGVSLVDSATTTTLLEPLDLGRGWYGNYFNGDIAASAFFAAALSDPARRRIENALARAFKLQTSTV